MKVSLGALVIYSAVLGVLLYLAFITLSPQTKTFSGEEVTGNVVEIGILAGLGEDEMDREEAVENGVKIAVANVDLEDPDVEEIVEQELKEAAVRPATQAAADIVTQTTVEITRIATSIAGSASPAEVDAAVKVIVELALESVTLEAGTLDDEGIVSKAAVSATGEAFDDEGLQERLQALDLSPDQEMELQAATSQALTSQIVDLSEQARNQATAELSQAELGSLENTTTQFGGLYNIVASILGLGTVLAPGIATARRQIFQGPLKLKRETDTTLRYAVTINCTIEEVRLEKPISLFRNLVYEEPTVKGESFPFFIKPGSGALEFDFPTDSPQEVYSWNIQLLLLRMVHGNSTNFSYAFRVNGRWQSYPIEGTPQPVRAALRHSPP